MRVSKRVASQQLVGTATPAFDRPRTPALPLQIACHLLGSGNQLHPTGLRQLAIPLSHRTAMLDPHLALQPHKATTPTGHEPSPPPQLTAALQHRHRHSTTALCRWCHHTQEPFLISSLQPQHDTPPSRHSVADSAPPASASSQRVPSTSAALYGGTGLLSNGCLFGLPHP